MKKTFILQLMAVMTQSRPSGRQALAPPGYSVFNRLTLNPTADGMEAVVEFQSDEEDEPQKYRVTVMPIKENSYD